MVRVAIDEGTRASTGTVLPTGNQPVIPTLHGESLPGRMRDMKIKQAALATVALTFLDSSNNPLDISTVAYTSILARFREAVGRGTEYAEATAAATDAANGIVQATVPDTIRCNAGIYIVEFGLLDVDDNLLLSSEMYLFVERSTWGQQTKNGPPAEAEIRSSMRDSDPVENEILANYEYDLSDQCYAIVRTVLDWNEQPPTLINYTYDTISFPFRHVWLLGIQLYLMQCAEEHYRRNFLPYNAGGISLDDKNRYQQYNAAWKEREVAFRRLVMHNKAQCNINQGFRIVGGGYPY